MDCICYSTERLDLEPEPKGIQRLSHSQQEYVLLAMQLLVPAIVIFCCQRPAPLVDAVRSAICMYAG